MFLLLVVILAIVYYYAWCFDKENSYFVTVFMLFLFIFINISFAESFGPFFYNQTGYTITNQSSISASDATYTVLSSTLTVVLGYVFLLYGKEPSSKKEKEAFRQAIKNRILRKKKLKTKI